MTDFTSKNSKIAYVGKNIRIYYFTNKNLPYLYNYTLTFFNHLEKGICLMLVSTTIDSKIFILYFKLKNFFFVFFLYNYNSMQAFNLRHIFL